MQQASFRAFCPFELGDLVRHISSGRRYVVEDILAIHSLRTEKVSFRLVAKNLENGVLETEDCNGFMLIAPGEPLSDNEEDNNNDDDEDDE